MKKEDSTIGEQATKTMPPPWQPPPVDVKYKRENGDPAVEPVKEKGGMFPGVFEDAEGKRVFPDGSGAGGTVDLGPISAQLTSIAAAQVRLEAAVRKLRTDLGL